MGLDAAGSFCWSRRLGDGSFYWGTRRAVTQTKSVMKSGPEIGVDGRNGDVATRLARFNPTTFQSRATWTIARQPTAGLRV